MKEYARYRGKRLDAICPKNQNVCKPVPRITVETLLRSEHRHSLVSLPYFFCDSPDCDVVYVPAPASEQQVITTSQLSVRVVIKETEDPIPLCYCFNFDRKANWDDIRLK